MRSTRLRCVKPPGNCDEYRSSLCRSPAHQHSRLSMVTIPADDPRAVAVARAIRTGDVEALDRLLSEDPGLAVARIEDECSNGMTRSLLHVATDWPGHFPNGSRSVAVLVAAGADVNARFSGPHTETPLHWAASSDDVDVLDALLDAGADIEAPGAVIAGASPLADAVAFAQWNAARRLVERGARARFGDAAALGLLDQVRNQIASEVPGAEEINDAFWLACHGGQRSTAEYLLEQNAELNWVPAWENLTPLDAARRNGFEEVVDWLLRRSAKSASDLD